MPSIAVGPVDLLKSARTELADRFQDKANLGKEKIQAFLNRAKEMVTPLLEKAKAGCLNAGKFLCYALAEASSPREALKTYGGATVQLFKDLKASFIEQVNQQAVSRIEKSNLKQIGEMRTAVNDPSYPLETRAELSKHLRETLNALTKDMSKYYKSNSATSKKPLAQKFKADLARVNKMMKELHKQAKESIKIQAAADRARAKIDAAANSARAALAAKTATSLASSYADIAPPHLLPKPEVIQADASAPVVAEATSNGAAAPEEAPAAGTDSTPLVEPVEAAA